jgi:hypothetical protein
MEENQNNVEPTQQEQQPTHNFFHNVMSVDETRVSLLMICLVASLLFGAYMYIANTDISKTWADIIETFAYCVTGINVAGAVMGGSVGKSKVGGFIQSAFGLNQSNGMGQQAPMRSQNNNIEK